jgi:FkbM family methyltransferase
LPNPSEQIVALESGLRLEIDVASSMGRDIYYYGSHESELAQFLTRVLKPGMTIVDGGANIGEITVLAAQLVGPTGRVLSVEASPLTLPRLRRNITLNNLINVDVIEAAICDSNKSVDFYLGHGRDSGSSSLNQPHDYQGKRLVVPGMRLDSYLESHGIPVIDCIKLDIEGCELAAVRGCERILASANPPIIVFEYHPEVALRAAWTMADIRDYLGRFNYVLRTLAPLDSRREVTNVVASPMRKAASVFDCCDLPTPEAAGKIVANC